MRRVPHGPLACTGLLAALLGGHGPAGASMAVPAELAAEPEVPPPPEFRGYLRYHPLPRWSRALPGHRSAVQDSEFGRPVVDERYVYVGSSGADALFRLERAGGELSRTYPAEGPVKAEPVLHGDVVLYTDGAGYTWCHPVEGDEPRWSFYAGAPILSRPLLAGDTVYVSAVDGTVYALDGQTGSSRWKYEHPPDLSRKSELELFGTPAPVLAGDHLLVGFHDGRLVALDRSDGEPDWELRVGEGRYPDLIGQPLVDGDRVYLGGFSEPYVALDMESRQLLWRSDFGTASPATLHHGTLYVGSTDGHLRALEPETGAELWDWDSGSTGALTQPVVTPLGLMVGGTDGSLWLVAESSGTLLWTLDTGELLQGVSVAPALAGPQVFVLTNAGRVIALQAPQPTPTPEVRFIVPAALEASRRRANAPEPAG